jgi:hypothetical protein
MEQSELLSEFREKIDEFVKCRTFIDKAMEQAEKFEASVIEKVVASHTGKANGIAESLVPLTADIELQKTAIQAEKTELLGGQTDARVELQELELRQVIGELTKKEFDSQSKGLKKTLEEVDSKVAELDETCASLQAELDRWSEAAAKAGITLGADADLEDESLVEVGEAEEGVHAESVSVVDDMSVVFDAAEAIDEIVEVGEDEIIEMGADDDIIEVGEDDDIIEVGEDDDMLEVVDVSEESDIDILADEDDSLELEDAGIEAEDVAGTGRRAVLLYLEGTAEEQVHPINTEVISLGRGRDNDIQVKNDSKVSRYHCKIYSRGPNYYIEDNKSANGSLVNGELITERRLFGGEEVIIGETFFRFRILD